MIKLIALDLDGTLTNSEKVISKDTKEMLMRVQKDGVKLILASGRPTFGIKALAEELKLEEYGGYILSFNGGNIIDCATGDVIYKKDVPMDMYRDIFDEMEKYNVDILSYEDDYALTNNIDNVYVQIEAAINGLEMKAVKDIRDYITWSEPKFIYLYDEKHKANKHQDDEPAYLKPLSKPDTGLIVERDISYLKEVEEKVQEKLGDKLEVYRSEPYFLEILPKGIDKAKSLKKLLEILGLERENLMSFGDGYNDISMIKFAGIGIAMDNAKKEVKEVADFVTLSNDDDGIVYAINKYLYE